MFITLTQLQKGEPTLLQTVIDNTGGKLYVALRGFHYEVGYRNVGSSQGFFVRTPNSRDPSSPVTTSFTVPTGLYTFEQISSLIISHITGAKLSITATGLINLFIPERKAIKLHSNLRRLLGIDEKGWIEGTYEGDRSVKILIHKWFHIYLDQLSTTSNIVDGAPSTLLAIVSASTTRGIIDTNFYYAMYKKLEVGDIHHLNLRVLNENGTEVQNREKPMTAVLEIRENV